jgi:tetratricopeptide (TPR) repeat protein
MTHNDLSRETATLTIDQTLQQAIAHHKAGQLQDAKRLYLAILKTQPNHPDANHNLGVLAVQVNQPAVGIPHLKVALEANPNQGQYWLSYIDALIQTDQTDVARQVLEQGRRLGLTGDAVEVLAGRLDNLENEKPGQPTELKDAITHREAGRYKEAALVLQSRIAVNPQDASAHALLAQIHSLDKQDESAWAALNIALSINPTLPIVQRNHARLLLKQQKPDSALLSAQAAYQNDVTDPENQLVLAVALIGNDQNEQALQLVENALQSRPDYAEALACRALLKLRSNDPVGALADAEKSLSIKSHLGQSWGLVGSLRYQFNNLSGAIDAMGKALEFDQNNVEYMVSLGDLNRQVGAMETAIVLLEKAVAIAPDNAGAWVNLGAALQQAQRIPDAKAAYANALKIAPEQAEVASNLGALAKKENNWEEALRYFDQALVHQPTRVAIITNRATALNELERYDEAEQSARHAIETASTYIEAYLALFNALIGKKSYEDAQTVLDTIKLSYPADIENSYRIALSYASLFRTQHHWTEAETWLRHALEIKPKDVKALRQLSAILNEQKYYESAWLVLQEAHENSPGDAETLQAMAGHHAKQKHWTEAETWIRRALAINPDIADAHNNLGTTLKEQGRLNDAEASYRRALAIKPEFADGHYNLGITLQNMGRLDEAEASYRRVLEIMPVEDILGIRLLLASIGREPIPIRASEAQLNKLYVERSHTWDLGKKYYGHELVAQALKKLPHKSNKMNILDAGCGTGLVGVLVRDFANRLDGIDMSSSMLEKARAKGIYDYIHQGDLVSFMVKNPESYDVVISAATLIHFGDLAPVFDAVANSLKIDGLFIFTLFPHDGDEEEVVVSQNSALAIGGCYAHSKNYIYRLATDFGFDVEILEYEIHEYHKEIIPVMGIVVALRRKS